MQRIQAVLVRKNKIALLFYSIENSEVYDVVCFEWRSAKCVIICVLNLVRNHMAYRIVEVVKLQA